MACATAKGVRSFHERSLIEPAGSPSYLPCTTRVFRAPVTTGGALTPPFHPCKRCEHFEDVSQFPVRCTALHSAGVYSLWHFRSASSGTGFSLCSP